MRDFRDCLSSAFVATHAAGDHGHGVLSLLPVHVRRVQAFKVAFMAAKTKAEARYTWDHTFDATHADLIRLTGGFND